MHFFVYILQADDGRYYIGQTDDIERRLAQHRAGRVQSTRSRTGWELIYQEEHETRIEAMKRERQIKARKSRQYIERLIRSSSVWHGEASSSSPFGPAN